MPSHALAIIASLAKDIDRLKAENFQRSVGIDAALRSTQIKHSRLINSYAPICSLPTEILSMIFELGQAMELAVQVSDDTVSADSTHLLSFEVLMTHVSSHFREVAIGTHTLWSSIDITPMRSSKRVATYISRSQGCELDVRVDFSDVLTPNVKAIKKFEMVLLNSDRCHRLAIDSALEAPDNPVVLRLRDRNAPALRYLSICVNKVEGADAMNVDDSPNSPWLLRGGAPRLQFVRLRGLAMHLFRPPLSTVTTLHLDQTKTLPMRYATFRQIVTASPSLAHLSVYGDIIIEHWPNGRDAIDMPSLRSLRICGIAGQIYSGLLLGMNAPQLESLVLKDVQEFDLDRFWASPDIFKFPLLQSLTFCDFDFTDEIYAHLFRAFPAIIAFTSSYSSFSSPSVLRLLVRAGRPNQVPWPKLRVLAFLLNSDDGPLIEEVIQTRKAAECPLEKLRLGTSMSLPLWGPYSYLREKVMVESFVEIDPWPTVGEHIDQDDNLFF